MQTEVSALPIVQLHSNKILDRKPIRNAKNSPVRIKDQSLYKSATCISICQKNLQSGLGGPYKSSIRLNTHPLVQSNPTKSASKNSVGQRVLSAKMLRLKQLQNQLADAHYHLNELSNENRLLKALHKRQDSALKHYEGTNAELPRIINSHYEELRALQAKYKRLKSLHKETCMLLKEKGSELQSLRSQNKHLLQLSKDRNLGEREKLQSQVTDLNFKIQQQQETIQVLQRKLAVDTKSTKQQLRLEISRHKETQINLHEAVERMRQMEYFLDTRTKRLCRNSQIPRYVKEKHRECQSLTNLRVISGVSNFSTVTNKQKRNEHGIQNINLPALNAIDPNDAERDTQTINNTGCERTYDTPKSETMTNLHEIRQFRLKKLECNLIVPLEDDLEEEEYDTKLAHDGDIMERPDTSKSCDFASEEADNLDQCNAQNNFNDVKEDVSYASDDTVSEHAQEDLRLHDTSYHSTKKSRELHAKLIQNAPNVVELGNEQNEKTSIYENEREFEALLKKVSEFSIDKYKIAATVLAQNCERQSSAWKSALECNMRNEIQIDDDSVQRKINNLHSTISEHDTVKSFVNSCHGDLQSNMDIHLSTTDRICMHKNSSGNIDNLLYDSCNPPPNLANTPKAWDVHYNDVTTNSTCNECHENFSEGCDFSTKKIEFKDKSSLTKCINKKHLKEDLCNGTTTFKEEQNIESAHQLCASSFSNNDPGNVEQAINESSLIEKSKDEVPRKNSDFRNVTMVQQELTVMHNSTLAEQPLTRNDQCIFDLSKPIYCMKNENTNNKDNTSKQQKPIRYNKEKLLATMKAIDDNENIHFLDQEFR